MKNMKHFITAAAFFIMLSFTSKADWVNISPEGGEDYFLFDLHFVDEYWGFAVGQYINTGEGVVFRTTDGGTSWDKTLFENSHLRGVVFTDDGLGIVGGYDGPPGTKSIFLFTTDFGDTWIKSETETYKGINGFEFNGKTGYAYGYGSQFAAKGGVMKTTDGGQNWSFTIDISGLLIEDISLADEYTAYYAITDFGGKGSIRKIVGSNEEVVYEGDWLHNVDFINKNTGFALVGLTEKKLLATTNAGKDWESNPLDKGVKSIDFIDENTGVAVGVNGLIMQTDDGGKSWFTIDAGVSKEFSKIETGINYAYACGEDGQIAKGLIRDKGIWSLLGDYPSGPMIGTFSEVVGDVAYVGTGVGYPGENANFYKFDNKDKSWTELAPMNEGRAWPYSFVIGDYVYVGGGLKDVPNGIFHNDFWRYDIANDKWEQLNDFPGTARDATISISHNGKGYIIGGFSNTIQNDIWEYDPAKDSWTQVGEYPHQGGATLGAHFEIEGKYYLGLGFGDGFNQSMFIFDPETLEFTAIADFPGEGRVSPVSFAYDGKGYVMGGYGANSSSPAMWEYDPVKDRWAEIDRFVYPLANIVHSFALSFDKEVVVGTGSNDGFGNLNSSVYTTDLSLIKRIDAESDLVEFGTVEKGTSKNIQVAIYNKSKNDILISEINSDNPAFEVILDGEKTILGEGTLMVDVNFNPEDIQVYTGELTVISNADNFPEYTIEVTGEGTTSASVDEQTGELISIYPTVVTNKINITRMNGISDLKFSVYDLSSSEVLKGELTDNLGTIDVSKLSSGVYILQVESNDEVSSYKFIKE